jgi:protein arginine kinase
MSLQNTINNALSGWMKGTGPDADIVISSRIRLARNVEAVPFPHLMSESEGDKVVAEVRLAVAKPLKGKTGKLEFTILNQLSNNERQILVEKHLISPQHAQPGDYKAVVLSEDETVSVMVNEEDHLRIQCLLPGLQLREAWQRADKVDDLLEKTLDIAFCEPRGFLTACPTNAGTGMRASVMVHLPAMVMTNQMNRLIAAITQVGLTVRGLYGEGSEAAGNLFQISNQITLGRGEEEILGNLAAVAKQIINQERAAREMLLKSNREALEDKVSRSYGILRHARIITSQEAINLLSSIRLGIDLDIIKGVDGTVLNELMVLTRPAYLQKLSGTELSPGERDVRRATLIRERLAMFESK